MHAPGVVARGCYESRIRAAGPAGVSLSEFACLAVPGLGPLRVADRDATLAVLADMGRIERVTARGPSGPPATCWRAKGGAL